MLQRISVVFDPNAQGPLDVPDIDWANFRPDDVATLLFIVEPDRVLLIRKKRGLGAGKISAPGGRLEPGETPAQAAIREVQEEVGVLPLRLEPRGVLSFQFTHGYKLRAHVFVAEGYEGTLTETPEATPIWFSRQALPFDEMWSDDALWLPHVLDGRSVEGYFVFDADRMLDQRLEVTSAAVDAGLGAADASGANHAPSCIFELPQRATTRRLASRVAGLLKGGELIVLSGPLGSGKTFFARALCRSLGVRGARVTSPTFSLVHEFRGRIAIAHADLYRLAGTHQISELGLDALRDEGSVLLVEWGEPYAEALGGDALVLSLTLEPRRAGFSAQGRRSHEILEALKELNDPSAH